MPSSTHSFLTPWATCEGCSNTPRCHPRSHVAKMPLTVDCNSSLCSHSVLTHKVFVKGMLEEELQGRRFLLRTAADLVAVRGAVEHRLLLQQEDFEALRAKAGVGGSEGGLMVVG